MSVWKVMDWFSAIFHGLLNVIITKFWLSQKAWSMLSTPSFLWKLILICVHVLQDLTEEMILKKTDKKKKNFPYLTL